MMTLLAPQDVARRLGLSTSRVIQFDREGILRAIRDSAGRRFYDAEQVERFALARERRSSEKGVRLLDRAEVAALAKRFGSEREARRVTRSVSPSSGALA